MDIKKIKDNIALIARNTTTFRGRVQETYVAIVALGAIGEQEARQCPALALDLFNALGDGINGKALIAAFAATSPIMVDAKERTAKLRAKAYKNGPNKGHPNPLYNEWNTEAAEGLLWYTCKPVKPAQELPTYVDFAKRVDKLLTSALKDKEGEPVEYATVEDAERVAALVKELRATLASMTGKPADGSQTIDGEASEAPQEIVEAAPRQLAVAA
jgi:hypothetical protein